jgi:hypothetical protein
VTKPAVIERLSARQAKVLRYVVSTRDQPVTPERCVVQIEWSDLPQTVVQARKTLFILKKYRLVEQVDKHQYTATPAGKEAIAYADKQNLWRQAPPPSKTNKFLHRKDEQ